MQVALWWGPKGFTNTIHEMDVRPGGTWRLVMHGPEGVDYPNENAYVEIVKPQLLVYDHISAPQFRSGTTFISEGEKTRVTVRLVLPSSELCEKTAKAFGAVEGLSQTLERLADHLPASSER